MIQLADFFREKPIHSILDVGTGTGDFVAVLKEVFPASQITGIDPNVESLKEATIKYPNVTFSEMNGEKLVFKDNSFDLASISMALHHLPDISQTLSEMQRVTKSGGWIIVNELFSDSLNPAQEVHKMYHHFRSNIDNLTGISHNETFKKEEILQIVKNSGIEISFHFESNRNGNLIQKPEDIEERVEKMRQMLEQVKDSPDLAELQAKINEFRKSALKYGFQQATKVVVVGRVQ